MVEKSASYKYKKYLHLAEKEPNNKKYQDKMKKYLNMYTNESSGMAGGSMDNANAANGNNTYGMNILNANVNNSNNMFESKMTNTQPQKESSKELLNLVHETLGKKPDANGNYTASPENPAIKGLTNMINYGVETGALIGGKKREEMIVTGSRKMVDLSEYRHRKDDDKYITNELAKAAKILENKINNESSYTAEEKKKARRLIREANNFVNRDN